MPQRARNPLLARAAVLIAPPAAMVTIHVVDLVVPGASVIGPGIIPRTLEGLRGIAVAPFLHADAGHLVANIIPLLILGVVIALRGLADLLLVMFLSALIGGAGTWLFGAGYSQHIGASGIVFGFFGYLLVRAAYDRRLSSIFIMLAVAFLYGTTILYSLIPAQGISWTGHVFGFVGGSFAARVRYRSRIASV